MSTEAPATRLAGMDCKQTKERCESSWTQKLQGLRRTHALSAFGPVRSVYSSLLDPEVVNRPKLMFATGSE